MSSRTLFGNLIRLVVAGAALTLIWVVWQPVYFTLGEDVVQVSDAAGLNALAPATLFLLQGTAVPAAPSDRQWQGRFAYVHRERKDFAGGPSKDQRVVDVDNWRPALRFIWSGGILDLPANSYGLNYAPRVPGRFWPRKWLGTKPVEDWHPSSTGLRAGNPVCAYGRVSASGQPQIKEVMQWPVKEVVAQIGHENRFRRGLTFAFKLVLSLGCVAYGLPRWKKQKTSAFTA